MKKILVSFSIILCSVVSVMAQIEKSTDVKAEEVPVAVRTAIEKDFNIQNTEGNWSLTYSVTSTEGRTIAKPLAYSYTAKEDGKKVKIKYTPEGKLNSYKGIEKTLDITSASNNKEKS